MEGGISLEEIRRGIKQKGYKVQQIMKSPFLLLPLLLLLSPPASTSEQPEVFDNRRASQGGVTEGEILYKQASQGEDHMPKQRSQQQPPPQQTPPQQAEAEVTPTATVVPVSAAPFEVTPSVLLEYTPLSKPYGIEMSTSLDATQFASLQAQAESGR